MSRTPETITDKKAEALQTKVYGGSVVCWLVAYGAYSNQHGGLALLMGLLAVLMLYAGGKIKTTYHKKVEASLYK